MTIHPGSGLHGSGARWADLDEIFLALEEHRARFHRLLGCTVSSCGQWRLAVHPDLRWPWLNCACPLAPPDPAGAGAAVAALAAAGRLPCLLLPGHGPAPLPGLALREPQAVYALDLGTGAGAPATGAAARGGRGLTDGAAAPPGVRLWALPAGAAGPSWADLLLTAAGVPAELRDGLAAAWAGAPGRLAPGERVQHYLAEVGGRPAGTGFLFLDSTGTAGLYGAAVLPAFRRRGVAGALVRRRLADAVRQGAVRAVTQVAPGGPLARTWAALGARPAYQAGLYY